MHSGTVTLQARAIRRKQFLTFRAAQSLAYAHLHRSVASLLRGGAGAVARTPFELYERTATQLTLDAQRSDEALIFDQFAARTPL
jgi:hypothetical protein